jgi:dCTP diphosphatase
VNDLRNAIKAFTEKRDWEQFHSPKNLAMTVSVEVSEVVEHFQWLTQEEESRNLPVDTLGIDPVEEAKAKFCINGEKYPATLVRGRANKYTEYS